MLPEIRKIFPVPVEEITELGMNKDQITNPLEAIRGRVPGLTIQKGTNGPAALDAVRLRGTTSLTSGNDPLIIVDGVFGDLSMLTSIYPTDIESSPFSKMLPRQLNMVPAVLPVLLKSRQRKESGVKPGLATMGVLVSLLSTKIWKCSPEMNFAIWPGSKVLPYSTKEMKRIF